MIRKRALLLSAIALLVAVITLPAIAIGLLLSTETGAEWLLSALQKRELLQYRNVRGSIGQGLRIEQLTIYAGEQRVGIDNFFIETKLKNLLYSELRVSDLSADAITVNLPAGEEKADPRPFQPPALLTSKTPLLPFQVRIEQLRIGKLSLITPANTQTLSAIHADFKANQIGLESFNLNLTYQEQYQFALAGYLHLWPNLRIRLTLDGSANLPDLLAVSGNALMTGDSRRLSLTLDTTGDIISTLKAEVADWLQQPSWTITGAIAQATLPLQQPIHVADTRLQLQGTLSTVQGTLSGHVTLPDQPAMAVTLQAALEGQHLEIASFTVGTTAGEAGVVGWLDWSEGLTWQGALSSEGFAANHLHPLLPEQLDGRLTIAGSWRDSLQLRFHSEQLAGRLHGKPMSAELQGRLDDRTLHLAQLHVSTDNNRIQLSGTFSPAQLDGEIDLDLQALQTLLPTAAGSFQFQGAISGTPEQPSLRGQGSGQDVLVAGLAVNRMRLQLNLSTGRFQLAENQLDLEELRFNNVQLDRLQLHLRESWRQPAFTVKAATPVAELTIAGHADWQDSGVSGALTELLIASETIADWQLEAPAPYQFSSPSWSLQPLCLREQEGRLCLSGEGTERQFNASLQASRLSLALLNIAGNLPVQLDGRLDIDSRIHRSGDKLDGHVSIRQPVDELPITVGIGPATSEPIRITELETALQLTDRKLNGKLSARLNDSGSFQGAVAIADLLAPDSAIQADISYYIPNLAPYLAPLAEVEISAGTLQGTLQIGNTLSQPKLVSETALKVPSVYIQPLQMEWRDLLATVTTSADGRAELDASLHAGKGTLQLQGEASGLPGEDWRAQLQISGDQVLLIDQQARRVIANPDLLIQAASNQLAVTGEIVIPEAYLRIESNGSKASLTADAVIHDQSEPEASGWAITTDLSVVLGKQVRLEAYGLTTGVAGSLHISQRSRDNMLGEGELSLIDGSYQAYGQDLTIQRGLVQFSGLLSRPKVDVTAVRKVAEVTAGLRVTGPVDSLQSRLFSDPAMTDSEILSYIIRGKPLSDTSAADQNFLSNAALSYALGQSTGITDKLAEATGLDEVGLAADQGVSTLGLTLGKYLTPQLYVRYGIGVVDKLSKLFAQYQLTDRLFLQTELGEGQSIDLLYRTE